MGDVESWDVWEMWRVRMYGRCGELGCMGDVESWDVWEMWRVGMYERCGELGCMGDVESWDEMMLNYDGGIVELFEDTHPYCSFADVRTSPYCAPSILITFINMVLFKENTAPSECDPYMFAGQVRD
jgi:hypothetical protein